MIREVENTYFSRLKGFLIQHTALSCVARYCIFLFLFFSLSDNLSAQAAPMGSIRRGQTGKLVVRQDTVEHGQSLEPVQSVVVWNDTSMVTRMLRRTYRRDSIVNPEDTEQPDTIRRAFVALKNNLLYDAVLTPNLQLETRLAPKWSLELGAGFNPFPLDDKVLPKWRHVLAWVQPKYWFCDTYTRDFLAFNVAYSHFNVAGGKYPIGWMYKDVLDYRFEGNAVMAGLSYGWHFPVSPHFSIELEAGADVGYAWYNRYECQHCGRHIGPDGKWFAVPKMGVNLVVLLDADKREHNKRCDCGKPEEPIVIEVIDTVEVPVVDTVVITHHDTTVVRPVARPKPVVVPAPVVEPEEEEDDELRRLRKGVFRPYDEYVPYTRDMVLSEDPNAIYIHFDVSKSAIDLNYMNNQVLLDSIVSIMEEFVMDKTIDIKLIQIVGMASFDGKEAGNERLAQNRALALQAYLQNEFDLPDSLFVVCNGGEGWSEFNWHMERREFKGKDDVRRLMQTEQDLDKREMMIKRLRNGSVYQYLKKNVLMFQRNSGNIKVFYDVKKKKKPTSKK